jgi:hypothetical protein
MSVPALESKLIRYATRLQKGSFAMCAACDPVSLPLFIQERYQLLQGDFLGKARVFALEREDWEPGTPGEYRSHYQKISDQVSKPLILVLDRVNSIVRDRLVEMNVPFICPMTQVYLPETLIHLSEKYPELGVTGGSKFTPVAQLTLLYHLQKEKLDNLSGKEIAKRMGCTAMMAGKVRGEFEEAGICGSERVGRSMRMQFLYHGKELWDAAKKWLRSPIKKTYWVEELGEGFPVYRAGLTALSELTMIGDEIHATAAMGAKAIQKGLESGKLRGIEDPEQATLKLESWMYDPGILAMEARVDPLSLWLSLRKHPDERVQGELETVLEGVQWR